MSERTFLKHCRLFSEPDSGVTVDILVENNRIAGIGESLSPQTGDELIDVAGRIVTPGFIDVHVQGAGGADVLDASSESLETMSRTLASLGTTSFLATTVVRPDTGNRHIKEAVDFMKGGHDGATMLGIHLEGPFINEKKRGGISTEAIIPPSPRVLDEILGITGDTLKMMTIAPEFPGSADCISHLADNGIIPAFGHSNATYDETLKGFDAGISHVTHMFNAMPPIHHREPGPIPAIVENPDITVQIIGDGVHVHPAILRLLCRMIGAERCVSITDGVQAAGLPEGRYVYNGREYESRNGAARYLDGTLIGSTLGLASIVLRFAEFTGCPLPAAIETATLIPAVLLGIEARKGSLDIGKDADIVVLDENGSVGLTMVEGRLCYTEM